MTDQDGNLAATAVMPATVLSDGTIVRGKIAGEYLVTDDCECHILASYKMANRYFDRDGLWDDERCMAAECVRPVKPRVRKMSRMQLMRVFHPEIAATLYRNRLDAAEVKANCDMLAVWRELGGEEPRFQGREKLQVKCLVHDDHNPSAIINVIKKDFHCYSCSAHHDVYSLVMEVLGCGFPEAVKYVNDQTL